MHIEHLPCGSTRTDIYFLWLIDSNLIRIKFEKIKFFSFLFRPLTAEEIALRREKARLRHAEKLFEASSVDVSDKAPEDSSKDSPSVTEIEGLWILLLHQIL